MAGEELLAAGGNSKRELAGLLFLAGTYVAFDAMSTINSSPWTQETFVSPETAAAAREYVMQAVGVSLTLSVSAAYLSHNVWPLVGAAVADAYLYWLYDRAMSRGASRQPPPQAVQ